MAVFVLHSDKSFIIKGQYRSFPAGQLETDDEDVIAALRGAVDVEELEGEDTTKKQKPKGGSS